MYFSESILCKSGELSRVWIAAHCDNRLSKAKLVDANVKHLVEIIIGKDSEPMALRLSSQLLIGLVRIHLRKTKYLLEDCKDIANKIWNTLKLEIVKQRKNKNILEYDSEALTLELKTAEMERIIQEPNSNLENIISALKNDKCLNSESPYKYMTLADKNNNVFIDRKRLYSEDINFLGIDLNINKQSENDREWMLDMGLNDNRRMKIDMANLEVEGARDAPLATSISDYIPNIQENILGSMHRATDLSIIDKKARLDNESTDDGLLPMEFPRHISMHDILLDSFHVDSSDFQDAYANANKDVIALLKLNAPATKIQHKLNYMIVDKEVECSPNDFNNPTYNNTLNLLPDTESELNLLKIDKMGPDYYTSSQYISLSSKLKDFVNNNANTHYVLSTPSPNVFKSLNIPQKDENFVKEISPDEKDLPFVAFNDNLHIPLTPNINADINFDSPIWDSPDSRRHRNVSILENYLNGSNGQPINLSTIFRKHPRSTIVDIFFKVLTLKTKDQISVKQDCPYGDIVIQAMS